MLKLDSAVGIEIQKDRIILTTLKKGFNQFTLQQAEVIEGFEDMPVTELHNRLRQYVRANGFNRENVILGLPRDQVVVRTVELPLEVEENLEQVVRFQVEKFEPTEDEKSYFDYVVLNRDEANRRLLLQVIMVPMAVLDRYLGLFQEVSFYPASVRLSSLALHQLLAAHEHGYPKKGSVLILDLNPGALELVAVTGPDHFLSDKTAMPADGFELDRLLSEVEGFVSRLHLPGEGLSRIYLTGQLADRYLPLLRERIPECELFRSGLTLKRKESVRLTPELYHAAGLAISGMRRSKAGRLNLIPLERRMVGQRPSLVPTALLLILVAILGISLIGRGVLQERRLLSQLDQQLQQLQPQVDQALALRSQLEERQAQAKELQDLMQNRDLVLTVMKDITELVPDHTFLQNLRILNDRVEMSGYSDSTSSLLNVLQSSRYLKDLSTKSAFRDRVMENKERFDMGAAVENPLLAGAGAER
jgi:Tfp pilus assembly protein PilN